MPQVVSEVFSLCSPGANVLTVWDTAGRHGHELSDLGSDSLILRDRLGVQGGQLLRQAPAKCQFISTRENFEKPG